MERSRWYKDAFVYQVYPRSFCDSNGDGIGDIRGIISKLDYIKGLGVTAVWLSPCYKSPNDDNGYDISDYRDIMTEFGTLDDWKEMVKGMHDRGIKLIMDLVVNHTSDEHKWFIESKKSKDNPYRDYYIWRKGKGKNAKKLPNNWNSRFMGPAWEYCGETDEYYLHLFTRKQPDLNWDNPKVRQEVHEIVKYWLDLGCDGFRCDVITYISKEEGLPNGKFNIGLIGDEHFAPGPNLHQYLHALNKEVLSNYDCMTVGEGPGMNLKHAIDLTDEANEELDTIFSFEHMEADTFSQLIPIKFNFIKLKKILEKYQLGLYKKGWNSLYFENHDQPRSVNRFLGKDFAENRVLGAKMLAVALYMQQGTPYCYQGQELGMTNYPWKSMDDFDDIMAKYIRKLFNKFLPFADKFVFWIMKYRSRDNARTPMQWDSSINGGFSTGKPWLNVNPNYKEINVEDQLSDPDSVLNFYKKVISYRLGNQTIINGNFKDRNQKNKDVYCYERNYNGETLLVICNFKNKVIRYETPNDATFSEIETVLHNYNDEKPFAEAMTLRPYEALVYRCK